MRLRDIAKVVRSKNAGPRTLTLDLIFADEVDYRRALGSGRINPEAIGVLYSVPPDQVRVIPYPLSFAIKIALPRRTTAGDPGDRDVYGAQQHGLLADMTL